MLLSPAIMALVLVSAIVGLMLLLACGFAWQLLRHWDLGSGSERQLVLERRTYLISTLLAWSFGAQLVSLLLFVYNAESLSGQFVGAMCATGVLNANAYGWPTLYLKILLFFAGAVWLLLNHLDNQGRDYPLIRLKYLLLLLIAPLAMSEFGVQLAYFLAMDPDVITSCCGALFSSDAQGVAAELAGISPASALWSMLASAAALFAGGLYHGLKGRGGWLFALLALAAFGIALAAMVSFIALYVYEHPHHHCPFCILKEGHGYVGYLLYLPLFAGTALALAASLVSPWHRLPSLRQAVARIAPLLTWVALGLFLLFYLTVVWVVLRSNLSMTGVWW